MSYRTFATLLGSSLALLACTGCETWDYRVVRDVTISRPFEPGSAGPLVLATGVAKVEAPKIDVSQAIENLNPSQIGRLDPGMQQKLRRQADLKAEMTRLQGTYAPGHPKMVELRASIDDAGRDVEAYATEYRELHKQTAIVSAGAGSSSEAQQTAAIPPIQTVLMMAMHKNDMGKADHIGRTFVLVIEGTVAAGRQYWVNADNSVLISYGDWSNPARTRVGLNGSVRVLKVTDQEVIADIAIRELPDNTDISTFLDRPWDPNTVQEPWTVIGRRRFAITQPDDAAFPKGQVKWIKLGDEPDRSTVSAEASR